jgi:hypothetical protein
VYAQQKVVERSSKKAPEWVGVSVADHIVVSGEAASLNAAKEKCLANIRQSIVNSVATNISSKELTLDTQTINGQTTDVLHRYESQVQAIAAKLPFITGISLDDAEIYWQKLYNKREKSYKYEVHAKYPFSLLRRNSLIMEYLKQEQEQNEKYRALKSEFSTFTEIEFINRAIAELKALEHYFVDQKRKEEAKVLASNYHKLYSQISIVPYHNALGEIVYYLNLEGRRMTTSRRPNIKSQYATSINFAPAEQNMYRITYNYDNCQDNDENKIEVIHNFASGSTRYACFFDVSKDKLQIIPYGLIEMDVESAESALPATPAKVEAAAEEQQTTTTEQQNKQATEVVEATAEQVIAGEKPAKISGWIDLRSKYETLFEVLHINFSASGTRIRVNSDIKASFEGKGNHRLAFNLEGKYLPTESSSSMARGVITILNKATNKQEEIKFYLPYKIVIK